MSIILILTLLLGIAFGGFFPIDSSVFFDNFSSGMLCLLIFAVGIEMGCSNGILAKIKKIGFKIFLVPIAIVIGTLAGGFAVSFFVSEGARESMAIVCGLGWYSLSGVLLSNAGYISGGAISFLSNLFREILTFILVPYIAKYLNYYCAVAPAGATAMDTTLPMISVHTDERTAVIAFISGVSLTFVIPFLLPMFL